MDASNFRNFVCPMSILHLGDKTFCYGPSCAAWRWTREEKITLYEKHYLLLDPPTKDFLTTDKEEQLFRKLCARHRASAIRNALNTLNENPPPPGWNFQKIFLNDEREFLIRYSTRERDPTRPGRCGMVPPRAPVDE